MQIIEQGLPILVGSPCYINNKGLDKVKKRL